MNTITAYAPIIDIKRMGAIDYQVIDAAQSVGKKYPVVIGQATILKGFVHYVGARHTTHQGVEAVISPTYKLEDGSTMCGDPMGALEAALKAGLKSGRDDRE